MRHPPPGRRFPSRVLWVIGPLLALSLFRWAYLARMSTPPARGARVGRPIHTLPLLLLQPPPLMAQEAFPLDLDDGRPRLSTPLAGLASVIPQWRGAIPQGQRLSLPASVWEASLPKSLEDAVLTRSMRINQDGEVQVYIRVAELTDENLQEFRNAGVRIELQDEPRQIVQARVPLVSLQGVADLPFVRLVRLPNYGIHHIGSVTTEGDAILKADQVRSLLRVDGTGVRVGVISDGIKGVFATGCTTTCGGVVGGPISTSDLPSATGTRDPATGLLTSVSGGITAQSFRADKDLEGTPRPGCAFLGAGAEGTALMEIVHDLAPGAQLVFANADTDVEFSRAVNFLASQADVVVDDIAFFAEPYDGTSDVSTNTANALNNPTNPIRAYFTSVGNEAQIHYRGDFVDSKVDGSSIVGAPGNLHLFQPTADTTDVLGLGRGVFDKILLPAGAEVVIVLTWNDPFKASTNDYDLFLVQERTGTLVASSKNRQGRMEPIEFIGYKNNTGAQDFFHIIIQNAGNRAAVRNLNMFVFQPECAARGPALLAPGRPERHNYNTLASSVAAESDAGGSPVSVISVGAIRASDPGNVNIEFFSSRGPTVDGRVKPDISGIDGVSVTAAGNFVNPFFGTSAAAPHGAGVAALLLQAASCFLSSSAVARNPVDARTILRGLVLNNAVRLGSPAPNNVFGFGRMDALAAANQTIPTANAGPSQTLSGNAPGGATVTLNGSASTDPSGCPLTFNWSGSCGTASGANPTVTCQFGANNVSLTVTNNSVTLSLPGSVQVTVTDFAVAATPSSMTVRAGQAATYNVTVAPLMGSFGNSIALTCSNLPAATSCSFSPNTVTPGANPASSTLTLSTTAPAISFRWPIERRGRGPLDAPWTGLSALVLLVLLAMRQRLKLGGRRFSLSLVLALALLALVAACGGGGAGGGGGTMRGGTPQGTFPITITGTSGSLPHSATVNLVVQ